jgi:hypothetical protein
MKPTKDPALRRWIIGLSIAAVILSYSFANDCITYYKGFIKANRLATGYVVEVDPGEPESGAGYEKYPGTPPSSHYRFTVNGKTYDGWIKDELVPGAAISVRYNSTDPKFNHALEDHSHWWDYSSFFLLIVVCFFLYKIVTGKNEIEPSN